MDLTWIILGLTAIAVLGITTAPQASVPEWSGYQLESSPPGEYNYGDSMGPSTDYDQIIAQEASPPPSALSLADFIRLIKAVIQIESAWRVDAVSSAGAIGLMQVMPANATAYGYQPSDLYNPAINIKLGVDILRTEINKYGLVDGLAAYNGGPSRRSLPVTQAYAQDVIRVYDSYVA